MTTRRPCACARAPAAEAREASFRYPWPCASLAELRDEVHRAAYYHGRTGVCAWQCMWLPGKPIVRWERALEMLRAEADGG